MEYVSQDKTRNDFNNYLNNLAISPRKNKMENEDNMELAETQLAITDVKHYAVDIDADGNEVRREIPAFDIPSEAKEPTA